MAQPNFRNLPVLLLTLSRHNLSFDSVPAQLKMHFVALCYVYLMVYVLIIRDRKSNGVT